MKSILFRTFAVLILISLSISACNLRASETEVPTPDPGRVSTSAAQTIEAQLTPQATEAPLTSTATHEVDVEPPPVLPTSTPTPTLTPTQEDTEPLEVNYTNEEFGFTFNYPSTWSIREGANLIELNKGTVSIIIGYRFPGEEVTITGTGTPAGDFQTRGAVPFLGRDVARIVLVHEKKVKAVYYDNPNAEIAVIDNTETPQLVFSLFLHDPGESGSDFPSIDLSAENQLEADRIIESFEVTFELPQACTDMVQFVDDVTIPDDTVFSSGETFIKTWRLRNAGTCTWMADYELVFEDGEQMGAVSPIPIETGVFPGKTADLSVDLTAPGVEGTYRGDWMLANSDGQTFGLGENADKVFWVQIVVEISETDEDLNLGTPDWRDTLDDASNWFLLDSASTKFEIKNGRMLMTSFSPGGGEEWGLATTGELDDFFMEVVFITGDNCSGLDRYGILARAPDSNSGYVFGFSCDGQYRIYKWDGENYTGLQEWQFDTDIKAGPNKKNRLGFYAQGNTIKLYANGKLIAELSDSTYDEGRFGLFIGSVNTENLEVFVDEISYWYLDE